MFRSALLALAAGTLALSPLEQTSFGEAGLSVLRERTKTLFLQGWNNYTMHALPADELLPLSCAAAGPDSDPTNIERNDVMGNFSMTLLDTLDMFAILGEDSLFAHYVDYVDHNVDFDVPSVVQVFEVTIRAMGGLLSAHMYASVPELGHAVEGYNGQLLQKAYDLGVRLLPAFNTHTGIPYPRVHLQDGVVPVGGKINANTCSAGAGSLLLEFGMLSRLTGDTRFEYLAKRAFYAIWDRRSGLPLVGMGIDAESGAWDSLYTGVCASVDSFYEYALKGAILFEDLDLLAVWNSAYSAIEKHVWSGWFSQIVDFRTGSKLATWIDALSAFWPGLQVLAGEVSAAVQSHLAYYKLWNTFGGMPERWEVVTPVAAGVTLEWYLLRPEFVESNYHLACATQDPFYQQVGRGILDDLEHINTVPCGIAAVQDVRTGELSDRMDSFFLSETLKYLYLQFTPGHELNRDPRNFVFSTEAHPLWSQPSIVDRAHAAHFPLVLDCIHDHNDTSQPLVEWSLWLLNPNTLVDRYWTPNTRGDSGECQVWDSAASFSNVSSSPSFYILDNYIDYEKPAWLYRQDDIEQLYEYPRLYNAEDAVCPAPS